MASVNLHCERVRSERFAQGCFSFSKKSSNSEPDVQSNASDQIEKIENLSRRCLLIREVSEWTLAVSEKMALQLFQDCLGETVQRTATLNTTAKNTQKAMIVQFRSASSVGRILSAFDRNTSSLKIPSPIPDISGGAGTPPKPEKKLLQEASSEPSEKVVANKRRGGRHISKTQSKGTISSESNHHLSEKSTEQKPSTRDGKQSRNGGRKKENKAATRQEGSVLLLNTEESGFHKEDEEHDRSDIEEKVKAMYEVVMETDKMGQNDIELLRKQLEEKDALLIQQTKASTESKAISDRRLSEKGRLVADLRKELTKRDAIIADWKQKEEVLAARVGRMVADLRKELTKRDAKIADWKQKEEVLAARVSAQENEISRLMEEHAAKWKEKEETHSNVCLEYQNQLSELKQQLEDVTRRLQKQPKPDMAINEYAEKIGIEHNIALKREIAIPKENAKVLNQQAQKDMKAPNETSSGIHEVPSVLSWAQMDSSSHSITNLTNPFEIGTLAGFDTAVFAGTLPTLRSDNIAILEKPKNVDTGFQEKPNAHQLENNSMEILNLNNDTGGRREAEW